MAALRCIECNSPKLIKYGWVWRRRDLKRAKRQQYRCKNCGRITVFPKGGN